MSDSIVRGRFAPTPSGRMHLGNVFCALLSWLSVKSVGGEMVLRIEDLDTSRCRPEYTARLLEDLRWLGLTYDEGEGIGGLYAPYKQSERTDFYKQCLRVLKQNDNIYPCFCSRDELHAPNAPHASDGRVLYNGACRNMSDAERASRARPAAYRLKALDQDVVFTDGHYGLQRQNVKDDWGDFIVRRSDGIFAYQLAVVVDDAAMRINQVVRGRDLMSSVAPQLQLYQLFEQTPPEYYHIPMLLIPEGRRLSKRDHDLDLGQLRARYNSAEPIIGRLLWLAGVLERDEPISAKEAVSVFSWDLVRKKDIIVAPNVF